MGKPVFVEINEEATRIQVWFEFSAERVAKMHRVPGRVFRSKDKDAKGPLWELPMELRSARMLRDAFKGEITYGAAFRTWVLHAKAQEREIGGLTVADEAELKLLPTKAPELHKFVSGRPYQTADIRFMAVADNPGNFNAPGGGKTPETIASIFEAGMDSGAHLVIAPVTSLSPVWEFELDRWLPDDWELLVTSYSDPMAPMVYETAERFAKEGKPFFLVTNPYAAQLMIEKIELPDGSIEERVKGLKCKTLGKIHWQTLTVDEFHLCGLSNRKSVTRRGLETIRSNKRHAISGTPIGGKTRKLWFILNWLEPKVFTSYWRWADQWLSVKEIEHYVSGGKGRKQTHKVVEEIKEGLEEEFYRSHAPYFCRRTRKEMRRDIPNVEPVDVWCDMTDTQRAAYDKFSADAEMIIGENRLNAIGILAEYTRLRQFATSRVDFNDKGEIVHTEDSGKLIQLLRLLEEHGIAKEKSELSDGKEQVIVFSQFNMVLRMVKSALERRGIRCTMFTGATAVGERNRIVAEFEMRGGPRVLLMNTKAGGVSVTLNQSDAIIFMDETWVPDDQEQAWGRNRENTADIYLLRSRDSIDEEVLSINWAKTGVNKGVLDLHRQRARAQAQTAS